MDSTDGSARPEGSGSRPRPGDAAAPTGQDAGDRRPGRLVRDPTLTARFTRVARGPRSRRFVATYPGAVVAGACLVVLAVVVGGRALSGDGSAAAARVAPGVVLTAAGTASTPGPGPTGTASPSAVASTPGRALTSAVRTTPPAPTGLAAVAGAALVRNPAVRVAAPARRQLLAGLVDVRLSTVVAAVAARAALTVESFQPVRNDPAGTPLRQVTVRATTRSDRGAVTRALADQAGDFAVTTGPASTSGARTVRLRTVARP